MFPSLSDLHYFVEMAHTKNVSAAALRLGLSQPTLSLALNRLEGAVGTKLFQRSKRGIDLTPAGRTLLAQSRKLIQDWESIQSRSVATHEEIKGRFSLGCHPSVALYTLPNALPELLSENPLLEIDLVHDLSRIILNKIIEVEIDIGVIVNPMRHPDLIIKKLCDDTVTFWTSNKKSAKKEMDTIICDPDLIQSQSLLKKHKKDSPQKQRILRTPSLELIAELTQKGCGTGILPGRVAGRYDDLVPVNNAPKFKDEICVVYRSESRPVKAIQAIATAVEKALVG